MKIKKLNTVIAVAIKAKKFAVIFKSVKILKMVLSLGSAAVFAACYAPGLGWSLAAAITILLFVHEFGHMVAIARIGLGWKLPIFIPFLGAALFVPSMDRRKEAYTAIGGPILGTLAALACFIPVALYGSKFWAGTAFFGLLINLFNLTPVSPLDGGRILQAVHPMLKWLGWLVLLVYTLTIGEPGMLVFWIICISDVNSLSRTVRAKLIWVVWSIMLICTLFAIRQHPASSNIVNWVDVSLGLGLALLFSYYSRMGSDWDNSDDRPMPAPEERWVFLGCYTILVLSLVVSMVMVKTLLH